MSINRQLAEYHNSTGETFSLRVVSVPAAKGHDERWEYLVVAENEVWGREDFRVLVQKKALGSEKEAEEFILGEPLEDVKRRLDALGEEPIDLFEVNMARGWAVM